MEKACSKTTFIVGSNLNLSQLNRYLRKSKIRNYKQLAHTEIYKRIQYLSTAILYFQVLN